MDGASDVSVHQYTNTQRDIKAVDHLRNAATSTFSEPAWSPNGNLRGAAPGVSTTAATYSALVKAKPATQRAHAISQQAVVPDASSVGLRFDVTMD